MKEKLKNADSLIWCQMCYTVCISHCNDYKPCWVALKSVTVWTRWCILIYPHCESRTRGFLAAFSKKEKKKKRNSLRRLTRVKHLRKIHLPGMQMNQVGCCMFQEDTPLCAIPPGDFPRIHLSPVYSPLFAVHFESHSFYLLLWTILAFLSCLCLPTVPLPLTCSHTPLNACGSLFFLLQHSSLPWSTCSEL